MPVDLETSTTFILKSTISCIKLCSKSSVNQMSLIKFEFLKRSLICLKKKGLELRLMNLSISR